MFEKWIKLVEKSTFFYARKQIIRLMMPCCRSYSSGNLVIDPYILYFRIEFYCRESHG